MGYIHSIETFGTVDGPGIRLVVFFQGCPMRCLYCHNPDTWAVHKGTKMSADEIIEKLIRNASFYDEGGITASGGEPMLQLDFLLELFTKAKNKGIHTCLDTSGVMFDNNRNSATFKSIEGIMKVTDLVLLDIKDIEDIQHKKLTSYSNRNILEFARYLNEIHKPVWIRHVVVPGITYVDERLKKLGEFLQTLSNVEKVEVLPYHSMGAVKYENLGIEYKLKDTPQLTKEEAKRAEAIIYNAWGRRPDNTR